MSAFAGKCSLSGGPVGKDFPAVVQSLLDTRGPDRHQVVFDNGILVSHCAFFTTPDSAFSTQPFAGPNQAIVAWDGRLDNRNELQPVLGLDGEMPGDAEYVSAAYNKWDEDFLQHIRGDYALSIWDSKRKRLLLARDPFGTRPLYYCIDSTYLYWSSEIGALLHLRGIKCIELDDSYMASYLLSIEEPEETPYKGINRVRPGTLLVFSGVRKTVSQFWSLGPKCEVRYSSDGEYEAHFLNLFRASVQKRLRVNGCVAAELSGGLDSSSVVCMADDILRQGQGTATGVETISHVYDESSSSDESRFIRLVEDGRQRPGHHIKESEYPLFERIPECEDLYLPNPLHCFAGTWRGLNDLMTRLNARVVLSGQGGDHVLMNETVYLPILGDLLREGRFSDLKNYLREWSSYERTNYVKMFWHGVIWPSLPSTLRGRFQPKELKVPYWLSHQFMEKWDCCDRLLKRPGAQVFDRPSAQRQYTLIQDAISLVSSCYYRERYCIEVTYPFLDQQLVEFLMAIPIDQKIRPGESRSLQRRAMRPLLPGAIARRKDKRGPDEALHRSMIRNRSWIDFLVQDSHLAKRSYVEPRAFAEAVKLACHGADVQTQPLVRALTLEMWLRSYARWSKSASFVDSRFEIATVCR